MGKASDMGRSSVDMGRTWASGLKIKQWLRWATGDAPLPDTRSRKIMAGTAGLVVVLLALGALLVGGGGGSPTKAPAAKHAPVNREAVAGYLLRLHSHRPGSPASSGHPVDPFAVPTTTTTSTTLRPEQAAAGKRTHPHLRRARIQQTRTG